MTIRRSFSSTAATMSVSCNHMNKMFALLLLAISSSTALAAGTEYVGGTPHSKVVKLTQGTFEEAIKKDPANSLWLLKFYAPWCGHCKRLAPILEEVAPRIKGKMAIGTIDCTIEKALCSEHGVRGYPTLKFARDGDIHEYPGTRKADSIIEFALKMSSSPVVVVNSYQEALKEVAAKSNNGVAFVAYHPNTEGETLEKQLQSTHLLQVFAQVARKEQHMASFALLGPESNLDGFESSGEKGFVVKIEENVPSKVFEFVEEAQLTAEQLDNFVKKENVAIVSAIGPQNFSKLGRNGRPLVIGVVDGTQHLNQVKKDLALFATTGPTEITSKYYYGWMDGREWHRFLEQFNVTLEDLPTILAIDVPTRMYWKDAQYTTARDLVMAIEDGKIESKKAEASSSRGVMGRIEYFIMSNLPWSVVIIVLLAFCFVMLIIPSPKDLRPPYDNFNTTSSSAAAKAETKETDATAKDEGAAESLESKKDK